MAAIYSNGGNRWNILGFNFTKRDVLSSVYKISMGPEGILRVSETAISENEKGFNKSPLTVSNIDFRMLHNLIQVVFTAHIWRPCF